MTVSCVNYESNLQYDDMSFDFKKVKETKMFPKTFFLYRQHQ